MSAAAYQINAVQIFKSVSGSQVKHLRPRMREAKYRAFMKLKIAVPVGRRDHPFVLYARANSGGSNLRKFVENQFPVSWTFALPIHRTALMRYRNQHIERALSRRCETLVCYPGVLHIKRGIVGEHMLACDVPHVACIVFRDIKRVVRN